MAIWDIIIANIVLFAVVIFILMLLLGTLFLWAGLGAVNGKHREFGTVFLTVLIGVVLTFIPCVGCILYWYMIKVRHETGWGGAIVAWLIAGLIPIAIALGVITVFWGISLI